MRWDAVIQSSVPQLTNSSTPQLDAELLLAHVLQVNRAHLHAWPEKKLSEMQLNRFLHLLKKRMVGEPIPYLIGYQPFWSFDLLVTRDTLIPRPETELLVEQVLTLFPADQKCRVADLGTGSGAIALALATERPDWIMYATDQSSTALDIAKQNAKRLQIESIQWCEGSWVSALPSQSFDLIVSNPPYLTEAEREMGQPELQFEPKSALVAGSDGLSDIRHLVGASIPYLAEKGYLVLEHGFLQGQPVQALFREYGYQAIQTLADLAGRDRVTLGRRD